MSSTNTRASRLTQYSRRAMSRDESRYPNGDKFIPERFLNAEGMLTDDDPSDFVFGFGRRKCPGRSLHSKHRPSSHARFVVVFRPSLCGYIPLERYCDHASHA